MFCEFENWHKIVIRQKMSYDLSLHVTSWQSMKVTLDIASVYKGTSVQKCWGMARIVNRLHSFIYHSCVYLWMEQTIPAFAFSAKAGCHLLIREGWKAELAVNPLWFWWPCAVVLYLSGWHLWRVTTYVKVSVVTHCLWFKLQRAPIWNCLLLILTRYQISLWLSLLFAYMYVVFETIYIVNGADVVIYMNFSLWTQNAIMTIK